MKGFAVSINGKTHFVVARSSFDAHLWALQMCERYGIEIKKITTRRAA